MEQIEYLSIDILYNEWLRKAGHKIKWKFVRRYEDLFVYRGFTGESIGFQIHYYPMRAWSSNYVSLYTVPDLGEMIDIDFDVGYEAKRYAEEYLCKWKYEKLCKTVKL